MSDKSLKVTDRRMFTPDGELKEEFRHLEEAPAEVAPGPSSGREGAPVVTPPSPPPSDRIAAATPPAEPPAADEQRQGAPVFFDLVGLLAEPATHYMRAGRSAPPQEAAQSLSLARLHIDLLSVLKEKTQGNLTPEEQAMLDDVVYQLRSAFVGLGG